MRATNAQQGAIAKLEEGTSVLHTTALTNSQHFTKQNYNIEFLLREIGRFQALNADPSTTVNILQQAARQNEAIIERNKASELQVAEQASEIVDKRVALNTREATVELARITHGRPKSRYWQEMKAFGAGERDLIPDGICDLEEDESRVFDICRGFSTPPAKPGSPRGKARIGMGSFASKRKDADGDKRQESVKRIKIEPLSVH